MGSAAVSVAVRTPSPEQLAGELGRARDRLGQPSGGAVFLSGALAARLPDVAAVLARADIGAPLVLIPATGVLSDQGEIEQDSAATAVLFTGARTEVVAVAGAAGRVDGAELAHTIRDRAGDTVTSLALFIRADHASATSLAALTRKLPTDAVFGAGAPGSDDLLAVDRDGEVLSGAAVAMVINGLGRPRLAVSHAGRVTTPFRLITAAEGPLVLELSGRPALELLSSAQSHASGGALLLAALTDDPNPRDGPGPPLVLRPIRGVDPSRGAVLISSDAREGRYLAFATRQAQTSREHLERTARRLRRSLAGTAPRFGLFLSCAGRGASLYGAPDVDVRILRSALGQVPFAGMQSAFELAPLADAPVMHLFTGALALFTTPS